MSSSAPTFKPYYIAVVDEEDYTGYVDTDHAHKLLKEYQQREGINLEELMSERWEWVSSTCCNMKELNGLLLVGIY